MEVSGRRRQGNGDDQYTGILCDPCKEENVEEPAVSYCTLCSEYLCETDTKAHRRAKALKDHSLLYGDTMPYQKLQALEDNTCSTHSGKQIEYFCEYHSKWLCTLCATVEHRECDIAYIDTIAEGYELGEEFTSLVKAIDDLFTHVRDTLRKTAKKQKHIQLNLDNLISEVKKFRVELNAALYFLESATLKEIQLLSDCDVQLSDSVSTQCDTILSDSLDILSNLESLKKYNQSRQLVIQSKKALTHIAEYERKIDELSHQNTFQEFMFSPNDDILQSLKKLNTLGHFPGMKDIYPPEEIDLEIKGELSAGCCQNGKGLPGADLDQENRGTMNAIKGNETKNEVFADFGLEINATMDAGRNKETKGVVDTDLKTKYPMHTDKCFEAEVKIPSSDDEDVPPRPTRRPLRKPLRRKSFKYYKLDIDMLSKTIHPSALEDINRKFTDDDSM